VADRPDWPCARGPGPLLTTDGPESRSGLLAVALSATLLLGAAGWVVADGSGTPASHRGRDDVTLVWPPGQAQEAPWVVTVLTDRPDAGAEAGPVAVLVADATAALVEELGTRPS